MEVMTWSRNGCSAVFTLITPNNPDMQRMQDCEGWR